MLSESLQYSELNIFYNNYIIKRIVSRLCAIYKGFGYSNGVSYEDGTLYNNHMIGFLILEYLKNNKNLLIE
jgi:hypothetical protein